MAAIAFVAKSVSPILDRRFFAVSSTLHRNKAFNSAVDNAFVSGITLPTSQFPKKSIGPIKNYGSASTNPQCRCVTNDLF